MPREHRVTFDSPGSFFAESRTLPIESWSPALAVALADGIVERYGAKPYGFRFSTLLTADPVPDGEGGTLKVEPKEVAQSGTHFLGGEVLTFDQLVARDDPKESILRSNMQSNDWPLVLENNNPWRSVQPFPEDACVVDAAGEVIIRGDAPEYRAYREQKAAEWKAELEAQRAEWAKRSA